MPRSRHKKRKASATSPVAEQQQAAPDEAALDEAALEEAARDEAPQEEVPLAERAAEVLQEEAAPEAALEEAPAQEKAAQQKAAQEAPQAGPQEKAAQQEAPRVASPPPKRRALPAGIGHNKDIGAKAVAAPEAQAAKRKQPAATKPAAATPAALLALWTERDNELPLAAQDAPMWRWQPSRIGADAAPAGPNGIIKGCNLEEGKYTVGMCSVHIERAIVQKKNQYFTVNDADGKLKYPAVRAFLPY